MFQASEPKTIFFPSDLCVLCADSPQSCSVSEEGRRNVEGVGWASEEIPILSMVLDDDCHSGTVSEGGVEHHQKGPFLSANRNASLHSQGCVPSDEMIVRCIPPVSHTHTLAKIFR